MTLEFSTDARRILKCKSQKVISCTCAFEGVPSMLTCLCHFTPLREGRLHFYVLMDVWTLLEKGRPYLLYRYIWTFHRHINLSPTLNQTIVMLFWTSLKSYYFLAYNRGVKRGQRAPLTIIHPYFNHFWSWRTS